MNGNPGDCPLADFFWHNLTVYGEPDDTQIRQLSQLMNYDRLNDWFTPYKRTPIKEFSVAVQQKLAEVMKQARESGWEIDVLEK